MKTLLLIILSIFTLPSCAGSPIRIGMKSQEELKTEKWQSLCYAYDHGNRLNEMILSELNRRKLFTEDEIKLISYGEIAIGMGELALLCVKGFYPRVNRTVTKSGVSEQLIFRKHRRDTYVYIEDGKVTSYQD